jgi:miniconductance mechanosensitive channel
MEAVIRNWLIQQGLTANQTQLVIIGIAAMAILLSALVARFVALKILFRIVAHFSRQAEIDLASPHMKRVFTRLAYVAPVLVIWALIPKLFPPDHDIATFTSRSSEIVLVIIGLLVLNSLVAIIDERYQRHRHSKQYPITTLLQSAKLVFIVVAGLWTLTIVLGTSPLTLLAGMGAVSAVLLLVFKDAILGFVAGIQLAANDMVRPGDWIEMPAGQANGDVIDVTLTTVKVRNFDNTISMVPSYQLISDSFKNWRGMSDSGGRRIKRSIYIDVNSICFCSSEMIEKLSRIDHLKEYLKSKQAELGIYNREHGADGTQPINGRWMTNMGTFRAYLIAYLQNHPYLSDGMTLMVRQLPPNEYGLPLEIYVFTNDTEWVHYEAIQSDIFDHIFAVIGEFGLRPFQRPSGPDLITGLLKPAVVKS